MVTSTLVLSRLFYYTILRYCQKMWKIQWITYDVSMSFLTPELTPPTPASIAVDRCIDPVHFLSNKTPINIGDNININTRKPW